MIWCLVVLLLIPAAHAIAPASLARPGLVVRSGRFDIEHELFDSRSSLVAVAVH